MGFELYVSPSMGFCSGVRKAIKQALEVSSSRNSVETLGPLVHNREVQNQLDEAGVRVVDSISAITGGSVIISAHGVSPEVIREIESRHIDVIDTTCPFVRRAQKAALKLYEEGYFVVVFGDPCHVEVKGILGYTGQQGVATTDVANLLKLENLPKKLGIISQTTQIPARFAHFTSSLVGSEVFKDREIRIIDTICHDSRQRQKETLEMAGRCDLVFVIGGRHSANTRHLTELCQAVTETIQIETDSEIEPSVLKDKQAVGVSAGASTDDATINLVVKRLQDLSAV